MEEAASDAGRQAHMVTPAGLGSLAPIPLRGVIGGFHARGDLHVDPRMTTVRLARLLERDRGARIERNMAVHDFEPGVVHARGLHVRAQAIVVCADAGHAFASSLREGLTYSRLQWLRVTAPLRVGRLPVLMSGSGLLGFAGFAEQPEAEQLRARLEIERPELVERGVRLRVVQLRGGELLVGDTQTYTDIAPDPFTVERSDRILLEEVRELLGVRPEVRQRWHMLQAAVPDGPDDFLVEAPCAGVRTVQAISPLALALCHLQASDVLDQLIADGGLSRGRPTSGEPAPVRGYMTVRDLRGTPAVRAHASAFMRRGAPG